MDHLPLELSTEILLLAQEGLDDTREWYRKRLVSHGWKQLIDGCPKMWRRVDLLAGETFVDKQIERAEGIPLWVKAYIAEDEPFGATWVVAHSSMIERLRLFVASDQQHDSLHLVENAFRTTHFPHLRHFLIHREGPNGGRTLSLPAFAGKFVDLAALVRIEFTGVSYPVLALASHTSLRTIRLDNTISVVRIALADLQTALPLLPLLASLTLGGRLEIDNDDLKRRPSTLASLTDLSFFGTTSQLHVFFLSFLLPHVTSWRLRLRMGRKDIPLPTKLRDIVKAYSALSTDVALRWLSAQESRVELSNGGSACTLALQLSVWHRAPCQILADVLRGVESLPSVKRLYLYGGSYAVDVRDRDDVSMDSALVAMRSVERVVVYGNGNSWVQIPTVLRKRLEAQDNVWKNVVDVEFGKGLAVPHIVKDWAGFFRKLKRSGTPLRVLRLRDWMTQTATPWQSRSLAIVLDAVVESIEGSNGRR